MGVSGKESKSFRRFLPTHAFTALLHIVPAVTAFLFVLDFSVDKVDWSKVLTRSR